MDAMIFVCLLRIPTGSRSQLMEYLLNWGRYSFFFCGVFVTPFWIRALGQWLFATSCPDCHPWSTSGGELYIKHAM